MVPRPDDPLTSARFTRARPGQARQQRRINVRNKCGVAVKARVRQPTCFATTLLSFFSAALVSGSRENSYAAAAACPPAFSAVFPSSASSASPFVSSAPGKNQHGMAWYGRRTTGSGAGGQLAIREEGCMAIAWAALVPSMFLYCTIFSAGGESWGRRGAIAFPGFFPGGCQLNAQSDHPSLPTPVCTVPCGLWGLSVRETGVGSHLSTLVSCCFMR